MTAESATANGMPVKRRLGVLVAVWLAALTVVEYIIAVGIDNPLLLLVPLAVAKGWLIMKYFMHIKDVMREEY